MYRVARRRAADGRPGNRGGSAGALVAANQHSGTDFVGGQEPNFSNATSHRNMESASVKHVDPFAAKLQSHCEQQRSFSSDRLPHVCNGRDPSFSSGRWGITPSAVWDNHHTTLQIRVRTDTRRIVSSRLRPNYSARSASTGSTAAVRRAGR